MKVKVQHKFHPNEKLRKWSASRTFGGTTKPHALHICGFRKKNFYILAGVVAFVILIAAVAGGIGVRSTINKRRITAVKGFDGQLVVPTATEVYTSTSTSPDGSVYTVTGTETFGSVITAGSGTSDQAGQNGGGGQGGQGGNGQGNGGGSPSSGGDVGSASGDNTTPVVQTIGGVIVTKPPNSGSSKGSKTNGSSNPGGPATPTQTSSGKSSSSPPAAPGSAPTQATQPSASSAAAPTSTGGGSSGSSGGGGSGDTYSGQATFYSVGLGSCGVQSTDSENVCALSHVIFDSSGTANSNNNPYCNRKISVSRAGKKRRFPAPETFNSTQTEPATLLSSTGTISATVSVAADGVRLAHQHRRQREVRWHMLSPEEARAAEDNEDNPLEKRASVTVTVVDRCPACKQYDLDLSMAAFDVLGSEDEGRIDITWQWAS